MSEIWKDVVGFEGYFEVSNLGRIRSKDRIANKKNGRTQVVKGKIRSINFSGNGYGRVTFTIDNKRATTHLVHRLVAIAFLERPEGCIEVNHKDMDKSNISVNNLEWVTPWENTNHAFKNKKIYRAKGSQNHKATLKEEDVLEIRKLYKTGKYRYKDIGEMFGVGYNVIGYIIRGKTWTHI